MIENYFKSFRAPRRLRGSIVGPFLDGFAEWMRQQGFSRCSVIRDDLAFADHFARWTERQQIPIPEWDEQALEGFRRHLRVCRCRGSRRGRRAAKPVRGARRLIEYLRGIGAVPALVREPTLKSESLLLEAFLGWARLHRDLGESALCAHRRYVADLLGAIGHDAVQVDAAKLRAFVLDRSRHCGRVTVQHIVSSVRLFVRYLIAQGRCQVGLDAAIPRVAHWHLSTLPRALPMPEVNRILATCDRATPLGMRDRAMLLLLVRLGLRASDVLALRLVDIDWQDASLVVLGKGRRHARLPLTQEVGDAILKYIQRGRPRSPSDHVFVRHRAPAGPLESSQAVCSRVVQAMQRAGVTIASPGAHVLRHSAATEMLRSGASLAEIQGVLRHRSMETTIIYAKVDVALLGSVVQPWPEVQPC